MYSAKTIANFFLGKGRKEDIDISPLKIIKLVYIAHGVHLGYTDKPLIEEYVQAWKYGPVIPELYHEFKMYGANPITTLASEYVEKDNELYKYTPDLKDYKAPEEVSKLLTSVWNAYKECHALQLSEATHEPGTPWAKTYSDESEKHQNIPDDDIRDYYKGLIDEIRQKKSGE